MARQAKDIFHEKQVRKALSMNMYDQIKQIMASSADDETNASLERQARAQADAMARKFVRLQNQADEPDVQVEREGGR